VPSASGAAVKTQVRKKRARTVTSAGCQVVTGELWSCSQATAAAAQHVQVLQHPVISRVHSADRSGAGGEKHMVGAYSPDSRRRRIEKYVTVGEVSILCLPYSCFPDGCQVLGKEEAAHLAAQGQV
jgi:hypothetical protein